MKDISLLHDVVFKNAAFGQNAEKMRNGRKKKLVNSDKFEKFGRKFDEVSFSRILSIYKKKYT